MKQAIEQTWAKIEEECDRWPSLEIRTDIDAENAYADYFTKNYQIIQNNFMSSDTDSLDIHKQAAILVISVLEAQVIKQDSDCNEDQIPIGPYVVALNVALSLLEHDIKDRLIETKYGDKQPSISMPIAFACDTPYFEIMCRMLYHEDPTQNKDTDWKLLRYNILEWADRFYLLEYITVLASGINPSEYKKIRAKTSNA